MNPPTLVPNDEGIEERASERMNFRTKPRIKKSIQRAAALAGMDDSTFAMNAAYRAAMETIAAHERTVLSQEDTASFLAALENPPLPTRRLQDAYERHSVTVRSS